MVPVSDIANPANGYNLNLPRYIDASEPEDLHDLDAHLNGGIPVRDIDALDAWWRVFPTLHKAFEREVSACRPRQPDHCDGLHDATHGAWNGELPARRQPDFGAGRDT